MNREAEFSRLLRWYPRQWRAEHGPVLVGTMMDAATAEGRDRPTAAERRSAAMHGLGARFNERFALVSAASATALAVIGLVAFVMGLQGISQVPLALVPWLSVLAAIALLRSTSALPGPLTVAIAALTTLAFALGFTAALSWSIAFDAADDGVAGTWFSDALLLWVTAAWVTGAAATALLAGGLLSTTRLPAAARISAAIVGGLISVPMITLALLPPLLQPLLAIAVLALTLRTGKGTSTGTSAGTGTGTPPGARAGRRLPAAIPGPSPARRRITRTLAWFACVLSLAGTAYAATGSAWIAGGPDGTQAMRAGIAAMLAAGAILLAGIAVGASGRGRESLRRSIPVALIAVGFACASAGTVLGTAGAPMSHPTSLAATVAIAVGVAALLVCARRGTPAQRWIIGIAVGLTLAPLTIFLLSAVAFTVPFIAAGAALMKAPGARSGHRRTTFAAV